ncbi:MAG: SUMF1/EgtB/PvdO family nonheme iron enzyme, partial [Deltaproteobacteria bacterium]|nr:SUMF1/EgtB/PvdO family nonheme iron enzyme [Deltaproteobacteria bacterium]
MCDEAPKGNEAGGQSGKPVAIDRDELKRLMFGDSVTRLTRAVVGRIMLATGVLVCLLGFVGKCTLESAVSTRLGAADEAIVDVRAQARLAELLQKDAQVHLRALATAVEEAELKLTEQLEGFQADQAAIQASLAHRLAEQRRRAQEIAAVFARIQRQVELLRAVELNPEGFAGQRARRILKLASILGDLELWDRAESADRLEVARLLDNDLVDFELRAENPLEWNECAGERHETAIFLHTPTGLEFVLVPGGAFDMGSDAGEARERPVRRVSVSAFLICMTECTRAAWSRVEGTEEESPEGDRLPVGGITWHEAESWCSRAGLRLPTEAEWEYACRAGSEGSWSFGDDSAQLPTYAWFFANSGEQPLALDTEWDYAKVKQAWRCAVKAVRRLKPNAFGLFDMHGNVSEWCEDTAHDTYE